MNLAKVVAFIKAHWQGIVAFGMAFWLQFGTQIQDFVHNHPHVTPYFAVGAFVISYVVKLYGSKPAS